jgi:hypothetical protein
VSSLERLPQIPFRDWWQAHRFLSPVQRLAEFVHQEILTVMDRQIIIFIDEIDSVLGLSFKADDFFVWLRTCFNRRADEPIYRRLTFVLLGVATPSQLIQDKQRTPFNIGHAIQLRGFQPHEAYPLLQGLPEQIERPQVLLQHILAWTEGQPFLTQKICHLIRHRKVSIATGEEQGYVEQLLRSHLIENWETHDEPEHLRTIRDRLLSQRSLTQPMLQIYQKPFYQAIRFPPMTVLSRRNCAYLV